MALVLVPWVVGPTFGLSLAVSFVLLAAVWAASNPNLSASVLRIARAVLAAVGIATVFVLVAPIIDCDFFPWAIECWFRP